MRVIIPPDVGEFKVIFTGSPVHITDVELVIEKTGLGFTVIVNVWGVPAQRPLKGVTVIVATAGTLAALIAVNEAMLPLPLAPNPTEVLSLLQV